MALSGRGAVVGHGMVLQEVDEEREALEKELLREQVKLVRAQTRLAESQTEESERRAELFGLQTFLAEADWEMRKKENEHAKLFLDERVARAERNVRANEREKRQAQQREKNPQPRQGRMQRYNGKKPQPPKNGFENHIRGLDVVKEQQSAGAES